MSTETKARDILTFATLLAVDAPTAARALDEAMAGWPTSVPMAGPEQVGDIECGHPDCARSRPCPQHGNHDGISNDRARQDQEFIDRELAALLPRLRKVADRMHSWATIRQDATTVAKRLAQVDHDIWCVNCAMHGAKNVRTNGNYCEFCSDVKSKYKRYPNRELIDIKGSRRVYVQDITRCFRKQKVQDTTMQADRTAAAERQAERLRTA